MFNNFNGLTKIEQKILIDKIKELRENFLPEKYLNSKDKNAYKACVSNPFDTLCYLELYIKDFNKVMDNHEKMMVDVSKHTDDLIEKVTKEEKKQKYIHLGIFATFIVFITAVLIDIMITIYSYWFLHKII